MIKRHPKLFTLFSLGLTLCLTFLPTLTALAAPLASITTTLTTHVVGQGTITANPDLPQYNFGQMVNLTANPAPGWRFDRWSGDLTAGVPWWDARWRYRVPITVDANGFERTDKPVELALNFTELLAALGQNGAFADNSLRLVEVNASGAVLNDNVPWQFDKANNFNATTNAKGGLTFLALGATASTATRLYYLYFDVTGGAYVPTTVTPLITFTDNVDDERKSSYRIATPIGTYYYHKVGGGFSSFDDVDNNDWLSYSRSTGSAGAYRGIPNMMHPEGRFHPGATGVVTVLESTGPLKITFRATFTFSNQVWDARWEIFPTYARMTMMSAGHDYWFLYEGTPGGTLDANDKITISDGTVVAWNGIYDKDIPNEEWAYASDPNVGANGRSLYIIHHEDDNGRDSYRDMDERMTILAFGRNKDDSTKYIDADNMPQHFTFGLMDETNYAQASKIVRGAYKDLVVTASAAESNGNGGDSDPTDPTLSLAMVINREITATFAQNFYTLDLNVIDENNAALDPALVQVSAPANAQGYVHGEVVTLTANQATGWSLVRWEGSASGSTPTTTLTVDGNESVTAVFNRSHYTVTTSAVDGAGQPAPGSQVQTSAPADDAGYLFGEQVTLTAVAAPGWTFQGWSGSASGNTTPTTITVDGNETVTATFAQAHYTVIANAVDGAGQPAPGSQVQLSAPADDAGYLFGEQVTVTAVAASGWRFVGWSGSASGSDVTTTITVDGNETVTATFARNFFTVTTQAVDSQGQPAGASTVQLSAPANGAGYTFGETVTLTAVAAPGWSFQGWSGSASGSTTPTTITVDGNETVIATFAQAHYTVNVTVVDESGTAVNAATVAITPPASAAGYVHGEEVTITLTPLDDWIFGSWSGDISSDSNPLTFTVTGNTTLEATFAKNKVKLTTQVEPAAGGTVTPASGSFFTKDEVVTVTAIPNPGWQFVGWEGALSGATNPATLTMNTNKTVRALFTPRFYTLEVEVGGLAGADGGFAELSAPADAAGYVFGEQVTLTATANSGYRFTGWSVNDPAKLPATLDLSQPVITFELQGDLIFTANFEATNVRKLYLPFVNR